MTSRRRTALGSILRDFDWDWTDAEREFKHALESNPSYAEAHHQYGWLLGDMGRNAEARAEMGRAQQLDPLSLTIGVDSNVPYYLARDYDRCYEERSPWLVWLKTDPAFDTLRSDPRYADLLRRMGLPQ